MGKDLRRSRLAGCPSYESLRIPRLHVDRSGTGELAHQPFVGRHAGDDAAGRRALEDILAVPSDEVAVVDDIPFTFDELFGGFRQQNDLRCPEYYESCLRPFG